MVGTVRKYLWGQNISNSAINSTIPLITETSFLNYNSSVWYSKKYPITLICAIALPGWPSSNQNSEHESARTIVKQRRQCPLKYQRKKRKNFVFVIDKKASTRAMSIVMDL